MVNLIYIIRDNFILEGWSSLIKISLSILLCNENEIMLIPSDELYEYFSVKYPVLKTRNYLRVKITVMITLKSTSTLKSRLNYKLSGQIYSIS